jgi:2',3'-cyclic-nucleotide 2'-phosphodiesterase (5'-nucleotidase family)
MKRLALRPLAGLAAVLVLVAPACARKYQAEQDGKDVGEALCDVRDADTPEDAANAADDLKKQVDDVASNYAVFTAEDRADINENVTDLIEHVRQGNEALAQQDITVIRRSLDNVRDDLGDTGQATVDGAFEGMDDCLNG